VVRILQKILISILVLEKFPSKQGNLGRKFSKHRRPYYPVSTNEIASPRSIDGNPTFDLEQCRFYAREDAQVVNMYTVKSVWNI
jgi:hypothetical protein